MSEIHPEFHRMVTRAERERLLGQRGVVLWFYGLSGSGKSTLAHALERRLQAAGRITQLLDGDNIRTGLNQDLGFSDADRAENIRRIAEVAKLFAQMGVITVTSFITPRRAYREQAASIIGADDIIPVYVRASYETCAQRDPKGLYKKAQMGQIKQFTGKDSAFEEPLAEAPDWIVDTETNSLEACVELVESRLLERIAL